MYLFYIVLTLAIVSIIALAAYFLYGQRHRLDNNATNQQPKPPAAPLVPVEDKYTLVVDSLKKTN